MESFGIIELSSMTYRLLLESLTQANTTDEEWFESFPSFFSIDSINIMRQNFFSYITSTSSSDRFSYQILQKISNCELFSDLYNYYSLSSGKNLKLESEGEEDDEEELDSASVDSWNSLKYHLKHSPSPKKITQEIYTTPKSKSPSVYSYSSSPSHAFPVSPPISSFTTPTSLSTSSPKKNPNSASRVAKTPPVLSSHSTPSLPLRSTPSPQNQPIKSSLTSPNNLSVKPYTSPTANSSKAAHIFTEVKYCNNQLTLEVIFLWKFLFTLFSYSFFF